jgi:sarcosine oxidase subunit alpha
VTADSRAAAGGAPASLDPSGSLLAAALAAGRPAISRSHRLHRPRGGHCARGYCEQCPIRTGDGAALACEVPEGRAAPRLDPLRPLGIVGERLPPWFYETRLRRPRWLRQAYLGTLRRLSSAPALDERPASASGASERTVTDVLVVGGGPAGIAAGAALASAGIRTMLVTHGPVGGRARRPAPDRQLERLRSSGADLRPDTLCLGIYEEEGIAAAIGPEGPVAIRFDRLVVATGAYDRLLLVAGNDLPGILGIRAFELLARPDAFGRARIGVVAAPAEAVRAAAAAERSGLAVAWTEAVDGGPPASLAIEGRRRVRGVRLGSETRPCDVLVLGFTQPTYELQLQSGMRAAIEGSPPVVVPRGPARFPLLVVGEAAGWLDPSDAPDRADAAARAWLAGESLAEPGQIPHVVPPPPAPSAFVCPCEDVRVRDVARAVDEGFDDVELVKRRTGATTGPCQGKVCLPLLGEALATAGRTPAVPTARPPIRPVRIASLGAGR